LSFAITLNLHFAGTRGQLVPLPPSLRPMDQFTSVALLRSKDCKFKSLKALIRRNKSLSNYRCAISCLSQSVGLY